MKYPKNSLYIPPVVSVFSINVVVATVITTTRTTTTTMVMMMTTTTMTPIVCIVTVGEQQNLLRSETRSVKGKNERLNTVEMFRPYRIRCTLV